MFQSDGHSVSLYHVLKHLCIPRIIFLACCDTVHNLPLRLGAVFYV